MVSFDIGALTFRISYLKRGFLSDFFKWMIIGWSLVVVGIAALGTILIVKYGEIKRSKWTTLPSVTSLLFSAGSFQSLPSPYWPAPWVSDIISRNDF